MSARRCFRASLRHAPPPYRYCNNILLQATRSRIHPFMLAGSVGTMFFIQMGISICREPTLFLNTLGLHFPVLLIALCRALPAHAIGMPKKMRLIQRAFQPLLSRPTCARFLRVLFRASRFSQLRPKNTVPKPIGPTRAPVPGPSRAPTAVIGRAIRPELAIHSAKSGRTTSAPSLSPHRAQPQWP